MKKVLALYKRNDNKWIFTGAVDNPNAPVEAAEPASSGVGNVYWWMEIPDWMTIYDFAQHGAAWRLAWAMGVDKQWDKRWQEFITFHTKGAVRVAIIRLLKTVNFRSNLCESARSQLVEWLEAVPECRRYNFPLSRRQLDYLVFETDRAVARRLEGQANSEVEMASTAA